MKTESVIITFCKILYFLKVKNIINDAKETLEMKDRVIKFSIDFHHLVIVTSSQCHVYR